MARLCSAGPSVLSGVLLAGYFALLVTGIGGGRFGLMDEFRTAERSREFLVTGDWTTVHLNFEPDFRKPPLQYWVTAATMRFADDLEWPPRLWSAFGAIAALLATGWLARAVGGADRWIPVLAMLFCLSNLGFLVSGRSALLDTWMVAFNTAALAAAVSSRTDARWWWACALFIGAGAWQKAPTALGLVVALCVLWVFLGRRGFLRSRVFWLASSAGAALAAAWPLWQWALHGSTFLETYFVDEMVTRTVSALPRPGGPRAAGFYVQELWRTWGLLAVASAALVLPLWRKPELRRNRDLVALAFLAGALFALLSAMAFRSWRYTILVVPLLSVCIAHAVGASCAGRRRAAAAVILCAICWARVPDVFEGQSGRRHADVIEASRELAAHRAPGERILAVSASRAGIWPQVVLFSGRLAVPVHAVWEGQPAERVAALPAATDGWRGLADERCWPWVQRWFPGASRLGTHGRVVHWSAASLDAGSAGGGDVACGAAPRAPRRSGR